jgi:non-ribosomal peptide synthetase-like protein
MMTSLDDNFNLARTVRLLNLGGEPFPPFLVDRLWHPGLRLMNTYGPSETTVTATYQDLLPGDEITIGGPLPMYHALLLPILDDQSLPLAPLQLEEGVEGELAIGGPCLANGYVRRPTLTAAKFIDHPIPSSPGERLYRTGDRVRLNGKGNITFIGRIDTQVKHRGFRIELGEIENTLTMHPDVHTAVVILSAATDCLEAYIVVKDGVNIGAADLRSSLHQLPTYMYPEAYHSIAAEQLPRLSSGKVNPKGLQDLSAYFALQAQEKQNEKLKAISETVPDGSDLGRLLRTMEQVFPQAVVISPTSDFFEDLGGHSLTAAMLVSKFRRSSPKESAMGRIALRDVYLHRTAERIIGNLLSASNSDDGHAENPMAKNPENEEHWPVSPVLYAFCGLAQVPPLLFFFFIEALSILGPYLVFEYALPMGHIGHALLSTYLAFVAVPLLKATIGIVGKWVTLGVAKPGEYPLYGLYYYRWWLAERFVELIDVASVAETPLAPALMRSLGASVGSFCHIGIMLTGATLDLVYIGDDVVLGRDVALSTSWIERGRLILAPVRIDSSASVGTQSVLEGGSIIKEGGEIGPMTMVPSGTVIPAGEYWVGSPAQFHDWPSDVGHMRISRPGFVRFAVTAMATCLTSVFVFPILYFLPQIPSILLFEYISIQGLWIWAQTAAVAVPATGLYFTLVFLELFVLRWLLLGKVRECSYRTTSLYHYRKWFVDRLMNLSLVVLHPVYATLYVVPFLRSLGVKIGHMAEVSTGRGIDFELTEIGDESFLADGVFVGDRSIRANTVTLKKTKLHARAFAGNSSLLPQGTELPSNSLVGVLSIAPEIPLEKGQSCFGSPPVLMPARQCPKQNHSDHLLYSPRWTQIALRLFIEGMRIFLPRVILIFGLGFGVQLFHLGTKSAGAWMVLLLPFFHLFRKLSNPMIFWLVFEANLIHRQYLQFLRCFLPCYASGSSLVIIKSSSGRSGASMCGNPSL